LAVGSRIAVRALARKRAVIVDRTKPSVVAWVGRTTRASVIVAIQPTVTISTLTLLNGASLNTYAAVVARQRTGTHRTRRSKRTPIRTLAGIDLRADGASLVASAQSAWNAVAGGSDKIRAIASRRVARLAHAHAKFGRDSRVVDTNSVGPALGYLLSVPTAHKLTRLTTIAALA